MLGSIRVRPRCPAAGTAVRRNLVFSRLGQELCRLTPAVSDEAKKRATNRTLICKAVYMASSAECEGPSRIFRCSAERKRCDAGFMHTATIDRIVCAADHSALSAWNRLVKTIAVRPGNRAGIGCAKGNMGTGPARNAVSCVLRQRDSSHFPRQPFVRKHLHRADRRTLNWEIPPSPAGDGHVDEPRPEQQADLAGGQKIRTGIAPRGTATAKKTGPKARSLSVLWA